MKRVVSSSIITLLIIVAVAATFLYLKNYRSKGGDPVNAIPADAAFVITCPSGSGALPQLLSMEAWAMLKKSPSFARLRLQLSAFDSSLNNNAALKDFMKGKPLFISGHVTGAGSFDFLFLKSIDNGFNEATTDELIRSLSGENRELSRRNYDGNSLREITLENGVIFTYVIAKGIFIASYTPFLVEDALRQMKLGKPLITGASLLDVSGGGSDTKLSISFKNLPLFSGVFFESGAFDGIPAIARYGNWAVLSISPQKNKLLFSGKLPDADSIHFISSFRNQQPVEKKLLRILPRKTAVINYTGISDFQTYYQDLNTSYLNAESKKRKIQLLKTIAGNYNIQVEEKFLEWMGNEQAMVITEPAGSNYENNAFAIFKAKDIQKAKKSLASISRIVDKKNNSVNLEESYNGHSIGYIRLNGIIPALFGESFSKVKKMYYTDIEDYIVFGNQAAAIRAFIDEYRSGFLLYKTEYFQDMDKNFPSKSNHFVFVRPGLAVSIFKSMATEAWKKHADQYKDLISGISSFGFQFSHSGTINEVNVVLSFFRNTDAEGVDQVFAIETDSSVTMKPLLTTDPSTKTRQILFQDDAGNLYLVDNSGNTLWKQPVDGKIMGEIFEIDLFKNNSRQFLFNTEEYLYLLDTKGTPVGNYPIRLPAAATNGLSVFDFDRNKDFKIYIACSNKRIYAYLASGKPLPGWNIQSPLELVTDPVRAVKFNGKEMLFINDRQGGVIVVNRFGEQMITFNKPVIPATNSGVFNTASGGLILTDISGSINELQPDGAVLTIPLNTMDPGHGFCYQDVDHNDSPDYVFIDGNELSAYNSQLVLIFRKEFETALSGAIQVLKLKNNEFVFAVRSEKSNKLWLVKSDGSVYPGFPVKGSSPVVIDELNIDGNQNLIIGGNDNHVFVYSLD